MIAEFLQSPQLKAWVKSELWEVFISAALVGSAALLVTTATAFSCAVVGTGSLTCSQDGIFLFPKAYLASMKSKLEESYISLMEFETVLGIFSSTSFVIQLPIFDVMTVIISATPAMGLGLVSDAHILLTDMVGAAFAAIVAQETVLNFIQAAGLRFFFPFGLMLRAFPITRKLGSTIIAIALIAYFAYPITLIMNNEILHSIKIAEYKPPSRNLFEACEARANEVQLRLQYKELLDKRESIYTTTPPGSTSWFCNWFSPICKLLNAGKDAVHRIGSAISFGFKYAAIGLFDPRLWIGAMYDGILSEINIIGQFLVLSSLLPILDLMICVSLFRSFSVAIGGEEDVIGMARLL